MKKKIIDIETSEGILKLEEENYKKVSFVLPQNLSSKLLSITNNSQYGTYIFLLTSIHSLFYKYSHEKSTVTGMPVERGKVYVQEIENEMLFVRSEVKSKTSFKELLFQVKQGVSLAVKSAESGIVNNSEYEKMEDAYEENAFKIVVTLENIHQQINSFAADIIFSFRLQNDIITATLENNGSSLLLETIELLIKYFINLLSEVIKSPNKELDKVELITENERQTLLNYGIGLTQIDNLRNKTIHQLFRQQVKSNPSSIAVVYEGSKLTYKELDYKSEEIAWQIRKKGFVGSNTIIGIIEERSLDMIVGILAILKAGCAYLPIDPSIPDNRIRYMLEDSGVTVILTQEKYKNRFNYIENTISIEKEKLNYEDVKDIEAIEDIVTPSDLAYVIYTSGSTGNPKGVLIEHRNVINLVLGLSDIVYSKYTEKLNVALVASYIFDASVQQIFASLLLGHTLFIIPDDVKKDGQKLLSYYNANNIDISDGTPIHINMILNALKTNLKTLGVKHFIIGGDVLSEESVKTFYKVLNNDKISITNIYGPTECCVDCTSYTIDYDKICNYKSIPIGKPMRNQNVYILDENLILSPLGIIGELYISGAGVGRGYLNKPELNDEKFIMDPFMPDAKMFKTGDLGRRLPDGNIEFLGRIDNQVKVRGYRIELSEIENKLLSYDSKLENKENEKEEETHTHSTMCSKCLLNSNYPGIEFDENGVCNICNSYDKHKKEAQKYFKTIKDLEELTNKAKVSNRSEYDCLLLYSGGKDSSYVLYRLVELGLKVITFTFDNGYISEAAFENIKRTTSELEVESIIYKSENMDKVFLESLNTDSTVCTGCFKALTTISTKIAYEKNINLVFTGLSRGQIFDTKLQGLLEKGIFGTDEIEEKLLDFRRFYHSVDDNISRLLGVKLNEEVFEQIKFVDFFRYEDIDSERIKEYLKSKNELWNAPIDTGFCSTNCLINDVGIYVHVKNKGYHNYASPLSWDCRLENSSRELKIKELSTNFDIKKMTAILNKIGFDAEPTDVQRVKNAAVVIMGKNDNKNICAFFEAETKINTEELRKFLLKSLPEYMIPSQFIQLQQLPLTVSGKIDRKKLIEYNLDLFRENDYLAPSTPTEIGLVDIWTSILDREGIGINDKFFELGGHSLKAMELVSEIYNYFNVKLSLGKIVELPTIKKLAEFIDLSERSEVILSEFEEGRKYYPLSSAQRRMYILNQLSPEGLGYNVPVIQLVMGNLNIEAVEEAFVRIINRHEAFRTSFEVVNGDILQKIHSSVDFKIQLFEVNMKELEKCVEEFIMPFNMEKAPLFRVRIIKVSENQYLFMMDIHHIICDAISMKMIFKEFSQFYQGQIPDENKIQYHDYAIWENRLLESETVKMQEKYWLNVFKDGVPTKKIPSDFARDNIREGRGETIKFRLSKVISEKINRLAIELDSTLYMVLLSFYNIILAKYSGEEDIVVGSPIAGRNHPSFQKTIGVFINTIPMRNYPSGDKTLSEFIREVRSNTIKSFENQDYPFDKLVEKLNLQREVNGNPLFDVMFALSDSDITKIDINGLKFSSYKFKNKVSIFDIVLEATQEEGRISFILEYNRRLYKRKTIEQFINQYKRLVEMAIENRDVKIKNIDL